MIRAIFIAVGLTVILAPALFVYAALKAGADADRRWEELNDANPQATDRQGSDA